MTIIDQGEPGLIPPIDPRLEMDNKGGSVGSYTSSWRLAMLFVACLLVILMMDDDDNTYYERG
jgi:hypothetical protein